MGLYTQPWTKGQPLRPVVVTFYGGGYIEGSAYFGIPPSAYPILNVTQTTELLFVYPNYRVNAFGLLPGKEIGDDPFSDLNPGLLDQEAVLKWVNKYIQNFGGDPQSVSVWGASAGAGSVVAQAIARKHNPPLINKALTSSPFWEKTYRYDAPEAQSVFDMLATLTGCAGPNSLQCLKAVDVQKIRDASLIIDASHQYNTSSYTWAPVIDGEFLVKPLSEITPDDMNVQVAFGMYNTHEGQNFVLPGLRHAAGSGTPPFNNSAALFDGWLHGFLPGLSDADIRQVKCLYPIAGTSDTLRYNDTYTRAGLIFRDVVLACPSYWMASLTPKDGWVGEDSISPATHGSDTYWVSLSGPPYLSLPLFLSLLLPISRPLFPLSLLLTS